ncbi:hypothetical protein [Delftia tsuruhatensis]|uniref:hypothetical protein n=1 Tax=Delftia tsuruhatensis TaxID=180282 RepID=UPI001F32362A|nr:hypothetical protein [Delftia tsuruhatensis]
MSIFLISSHSLQASRRTAQAGARMRKTGVVASTSFLRLETVAFTSRRCSA